MRNMLSRAMRAALLNRGVFCDVAEDPTAILHPTGIVVLVGIAIGLGLEGALADIGKPAAELGSIVDRLVGTWLAIMTTLVGWIVWAAVAFATGTWFLGGRAGFRPILRALGIGYGPGVLLVAASLPGVGPIALAVGHVWVLVTGVVAVHETGEVDWFGAFLATVLGWFLGFIVLRAVFLSA